MADNKIAVVTGNFPSSGTSDFTRSDFGTVKGAIIIANSATVASNPRSSSIIGVAFFDGTNLYDMSLTSLNSQSLTDSKRYTDDDNLTSWVWLQSVTGIKDGLRFTYSSGLAGYVTVILFGGADTECECGQVTDTDGVRNITLSGSFQPDVVLMTSVGDSSTDSNSVHELLSFGVSDGVNDYCMAWRSLTSQVDAANHEILSENKSVGQSSGAGGWTWDGTCEDFDSTGFSTNINNGGTGDVLHYMAIKYENGISIGSYSSKTSPGTKSETGLGLTPDGVLLCQTRCTTADTWLTDTALADGFSIGSMDGTEEQSLDYSAENAKAETSCHSYRSSSALCKRESVSGVLDTVIEAAYDSFDSDGFTLDYTTVEGTARLGWYMAVGTTSAAATAGALVRVQQSRPSYASGFARSASESASPRLWKDLQIAAVPTLGSMGDVLKSWGKNKGGETYPLYVNSSYTLDQGPCLYSNIYGTQLSSAADQGWDGDGDELSIACRIKLGNYSANGSFYIWGKGVSVGTGAHLVVGVNTSGYYTAWHYYWDGGGVFLEAQDAIIRDVEWVDLAATLSNDALTLFVNGKEVDSKARINTDAGQKTRNWKTGNAIYSSRSRHYGKSYYAWSRILADDEIREVARDDVAPFRRKSRIPYSLPAETETTTTTGALVRVQQSRPSYASGFARSDSESAFPSLRRGLVGAWVPPLGATGGTLRDVVGKNDGVLTGFDLAADWVATEKGIALSFDGANSFIPVDINSALEVGDKDFTILCCYLPANKTAYHVAVSNTNGVYGYDLWGVRQTTGYSQFTIDDNTTKKEVKGTTDVVDGYWHQAVGIRKDTNIHLYVDGVEDNVPVDIGNYGSLNNTQPLRIGASASAVYKMAGLVGTTLLFNRAITPSEVKHLYQDPLAPFRRKSRIVWSTGEAAATDHAITGDASASGSASLTVGQSHAISGGASATSSAELTATRTIPISGDASAAASASATVAQTNAIVGDASASASASLTTIKTIPVAGGATASSSASATVDASGSSPISGGVTASSSAGATTSQTHAVTGDASAVGSASGTFAQLHSIVGQAIAAASATITVTGGGTTVVAVAQTLTPRARARLLTPRAVTRSYTA